MSGSGYEKRRQADAIRAANMKANGRTTREIAEAIGVKPEQVKNRVLLGERLKGMTSNVMEIRDTPAGLLRLCLSRHCRSSNGGRVDRDKHAAEQVGRSRDRRERCSLHRRVLRRGVRWPSRTPIGTTSVNEPRNRLP